MSCLQLLQPVGLLFDGVGFLLVFFWGYRKFIYVGPSDRIRGNPDLAVITDSGDPNSSETSSGIDWHTFLGYSGAFLVVAGFVLQFISAVALFINSS